MRISFSSVLLLFPFLIYAADYLDNHSCKECHEKIYEEYQHSAHHLSYFTDELHRKVAQKAEPKSYSCAPCHMPAAGDLQGLVEGRIRPNGKDRREKDGVSCFFCHTIAYVKKAHRFNRNIPARQAEGYKPSLFGSLVNPDESDKHSSLKSPIYIDNACSGCHSHKVNDNNVTIFRAMGPTDTSRGCVRCHMPRVPGGVEKMDKRGRGEHRSHRFPGLEDAKFRATGYDLSVERKGKGIEVTFVNKMPHPMIIQPARAKYLEIEVKRKDKTIWRNYIADPREDVKAFFAFHFSKGGKDVALPSVADAVRANNLQGKERRTFHYEIPDLQPGDEVTVSLYALKAKPACQKVVHLDDPSYTRPILLKRIVHQIQ
ncbi:multiheme c-type cytochrome [Nitratifractor sp.]